MGSTGGDEPLQSSAFVRCGRNRPVNERTMTGALRATRGRVRGDRWACGMLAPFVFHPLFFSVPPSVPFTATQSAPKGPQSATDPLSCDSVLVAAVMLLDRWQR